MTTLADLQDPEIRRIFDWDFDFSLDVDQYDIEETNLNADIPYEVFASEGTGGVFVAYGNGPTHLRPILHGTSEGQAGRIAGSLGEWIAILLALPYWRDVLKFSNSGDLVSMRESAEIMEQHYFSDNGQIIPSRDTLRKKLDLPDIQDPVAVLHSNVKQTTYTLVDPEGDIWETLFNEFTSDALRRAMNRAQA